MSCKVVVPSGYESGERRDVLFLTSEDDKFVNVAEAFDAMDWKLREDFQASFSWWTDRKSVV